MRNNFQIVIDESVDYAIARALKNTEFSVFVISEESPSIPDQKVLKIAYTNNALLIIEDKDFGELVFRFQLKHAGVLLIRMIEAKSLEKAEAAIKAIEMHFADMLHGFSVLDNHKIRIRK